MTDFIDILNMLRKLPIDMLIMIKKVVDGLIAEFDGLNHRGHSSLHGCDSNGALAGRVPASDVPLCASKESRYYQKRTKRALAKCHKAITQANKAMNKKTQRKDY